MRMPREFIKNRNGGYYLHVYNHITTPMPDYYPLTDKIHQDKFFKICTDYLVKYNLEVISLVCMGNHFHMLVYCPEEKMNIEEAADAYNAFHAHEKHPRKVDTDSYQSEHVQKHCNDISEYMREVQRSYSEWHNKNCCFKSSGHLWKSRFQTQLIQSATYLWACLKYIEMNPVRAGLCATPEEFPASTFGLWCENGKHTFEKAFLHHIVSLANDSENIQMDDFKPYLSSELSRLSYTDEMKKLIACGNISEAQILEDLYREQSESEILNVEVVAFSVRDYHSKKFIGSKKFIAKQYMNWLAWQPPKRPPSDESH
ncbi:MAG: hypothetical protein HRT88_09660 [Lentisphaeraceae bacterium]|nr:hypothetical protein [Lentisphaeraceae bacterium]